jgi:hypothetical protein
VDELLRWLDVIPGRAWLLLGPGAAELADLVRAEYKPAGVILAEDTAGFADCTFDVAIATGPADAAELRRVLVPGGTAAALHGANFATAGLRVVQTRGMAVRGTR